MNILISNPKGYFLKVLGLIRCANHIVPTQERAPNCFGLSIFESRRMVATQLIPDEPENTVLRRKVTQSETPVAQG